jgi:glutamate synthase domain-containing protein 2
MVRLFFLFSSVVALSTIGVVDYFWPPILYALIIVLPFVIIGMVDLLQRRQSLLRNYPVIGHGRYLLESIRPEIQQYFVESNIDGTPFSREFRSVVYQRAKGALQTVPFGTQRDVYRAGYEWLNHCSAPTPVPEEEHRVVIGGAECKAPYLASHLNVSAMSYGSLSKQSIMALNKGAREGGFFHNTGEGGISPHHLKYGGDLVWQVGTGYFGCRGRDGGFDGGLYAENAKRPEVKMIELKLSQGAKPAHGGILPAAKVTTEISQIRGVPLGKDVLSPPVHREFDTPLGLLEFIQRLRDLSGAKPVGFKLCVGRPVDFYSICKAMVESEIYPDFITIDGGEGGTGAAPMEFTNSVGMPLRDGLLLAHNVLVGCGIRDRLRLIASGKVVTGFHIIRAMALGADLCNSARAMMFALGCIQARRCHENNCPVGVATTRPGLGRALDIGDKARRVAAFHQETIHGFVELVSAAGLASADDIEPRHVMRRIDQDTIKDYAEIYQYCQPGVLLGGKGDSRMQELFDRAQSNCFSH